MHGIWARQKPSYAIANRDDARRCNGGTSAVTARGSSRATLVAIAQGWALSAQDGQLMPQDGEFELQRSAAAQPEREQGTDSGQEHEHAYAGMTAAPETLCFLGLLEF